MCSIYLSRFAYVLPPASPPLFLSPQCSTSLFSLVLCLPSPPLLTFSSSSSLPLFLSSLFASPPSALFLTAYKKFQRFVTCFLRLREFSTRSFKHNNRTHNNSNHSNSSNSSNKSFNFLLVLFLFLSFFPFLSLLLLLLLSSIPSPSFISPFVVQIQERIRTTFGVKIASKKTNSSVVDHSLVILLVCPAFCNLMPVLLIGRYFFWCENCWQKPIRPLYPQEAPTEKHVTSSTGALVTSYTLPNYAPETTVIIITVTTNNNNSIVPHRLS